MYEVRRARYLSRMIKYLAILTKQAWPIIDTLCGQNKAFSIERKISSFAHSDRQISLGKQPTFCNATGFPTK